MRKAVDLIVEQRQADPVEQAEAREKLWTPEKEGDAACRQALDAGLLSTPVRACESAGPAGRENPLLDCGQPPAPMLSRIRRKDSVPTRETKREP